MSEVNFYGDASLSFQFYDDENHPHFLVLYPHDPQSSWDDFAIVGTYEFIKHLVENFWLKHHLAQINIFWFMLLGCVVQLLAKNYFGASVRRSSGRRSDGRLLAMT